MDSMNALSTKSSDGMEGLDGNTLMATGFIVPWLSPSSSSVGIEA
jgi:hypothetical protein